MDRPRVYIETTVPSYLAAFRSKDIMNLDVIRKLRVANVREGRETPIILTPQAMLESLED